MVNKSIIFFLGLCPIIPIIAHFAEGILFVAEFWFLFAVGIASTMLINYFKIEKLSHIVLYLHIILAAALYAQIVGVMFPVIAIGIERYLYIAAFSYILSISLGMYTSNRYPFEIPILYSILVAAISILRELAVFGTISLPARSGLFSITLIPFSLPLKFWGSNAGTLMMLGVALWLFRSVHKGELLPVQTDEASRTRQ